MARRISRGPCAYCNRELGKSVMTRHLQHCPRRRDALQANPGQGRLMHLVVEGRYLPEYWLHIELPASSRLGTLDDFLRDTWLECCGHLSAFRAGNVSYTTFVDDTMVMWNRIEERSMDGVKLSVVFRPDQRIYYEYDFGTTTDLTLRLVDERKGPVKDQPVRVLARNDPPTIPCGNCGGPATGICAYCVWESAGWLCNRCMESHACGTDAVLPVVNSPRTGMCAYTGSSGYDPAQSMP